MVKMKKKLEEMSAEEFMLNGLNSDNDDDAENENNLENDEEVEKSEKKGKSHKEQLDRLKEKDPEFYKYLQDHDEELLEFSASDDEDLADLSDNEEEYEKTENGGGEEEDQDDIDDVELEEEEEGKKVTHEMIAKWKTGLEKDNLKTLKTVMAAFHASVSVMAPEEEESSSTKALRFSARESSIFNSLATQCLKHTIRILNKNISYTKEKKSKGSTALPTTSKNWGKIKVTIKQYLQDLLQLLRQLAEPSMLTIILRHCQLLCPYYCCFPKILKMLLKRLSRMWSTGEEHVRVLAFMCIRKSLTLQPNLFEFVLKKMYFGFVQNSKFVTPKTKPLLVFMQNSLVEMFSLNETITYQHAFIYIRQLAIHLRNAITVKKKDGHLAVYNWQFISCLQLWCRVVGELYGETLKPLVYPIVQITIGVLRLVPAARFYPIRFQCVDILNYLSRKTNVYIPTASFIVEAIESKEFLKKPSTNDKIPDLKLVLKVSKSQTTSKAFQDAIVDISFESLLEHYVIYSNSIAFPELIFPICHRLKRLTKSCKVFKLCKDMKTLIDKVQKYGDAFNKERNKVTFSPKDTEQVRQWEAEQKQKQNTLDQFFQTWKEMKTMKVDDEDEEEEAENEDEDDENEKKPLKSRKRKSQQQPQNVNKKNEPQISTSVAAAGKNKKPAAEPKKKRAKKVDKPKVRQPRGDEEDILQDFTFSDDDN